MHFKERMYTEYTFFLKTYDTLHVQMGSHYAHLLFA